MRKMKRWVLGVGFDEAKGHKRITKGDNFLLFGGSKETHGEMTEKVIKLNEQLKKKGKNLDDVSLKELENIADRVGLHPLRNREIKK